MSAYNYSFNNPVMFNDPSGADPKDGDPKPQPKQQTGSIVHKKPVQPLFGQSILMPPLQKSDHPEDDSKGNVIRSVQLKEAVAKNQATAKQAEMVRNVKLDERHIGATKDGQYYNVSQREIKRAEYESNEAYGSMVRNGGLGVGLAYAVGGKEAVKYGALVDGIAMSFAGVGTPYGKTSAIEEVPMTVNGFETEQIPLETKSSYVINRNSLSTWQDEDAARYLEGNGNAAYMATEDGGVMILKPGATVQEIYEEEVHHTQRMEHGMDYFLKNRTLLEIQAQDILLKYGKENGWSFEEMTKIQTAKDTWLKIYKTEQNGRQ